MATSQATTQATTSRDALAANMTTTLSNGAGGGGNQTPSAVAADAANSANKGTKRTSIGDESAEALPKSKRLANAEPLIADDTVTPKPTRLADRNNNEKKNNNYNNNNDTIVLDDDSSSTDSNEIVYIQTKVCTRSRTARAARNRAQAQAHQQAEVDLSTPSTQLTTSSKATSPKQTPSGVPTVTNVDAGPAKATEVVQTTPAVAAPQALTQASPAPVSQATTATAVPVDVQPPPPQPAVARNTATAAANTAPVTRPPQPAPAPAPPARPSIPVTDRLLATVADVFPNISVDRIRSLVQQMPVENGVDPSHLPEELQINMVMNHLLFHNPDLDAREEDINALNSVLDGQSNNGGNNDYDDEDESFAYVDEPEEDDEEGTAADSSSNLAKDEVDEMIENALQDYIASAAKTAETTYQAAATATTSAAAAIQPNLANMLSSPKLKRNLKNDLREVMAVLVDCDPIYLIGQAMIYQNSPNRVENVISSILEKKSYPKLRDFKEKERRKKDLENHLNMELNMEEFLKLYPNPVAHFYNTDPEVSSNYKRHCQAYLCNKFVYFTSDTVEDVLRRHRYHLTPAFQQINGAFDERVIVSRIAQHLTTHMNRGRNMPKLQMTRNYFKYKIENQPRNSNSYEYPPNLDEQFFKELVFVKNEAQIKTFLRNREEQRKKKYEAAKANKQLLECTCCCNDELIDEDMCACPNGHQCCKECIKQFLVTLIGDSKYDFKCWVTDCNLEFPMKVISQVLEPNVFSKMIRNRQNEEIRKADIPNLETCQHCMYAAIIENPAEKVFYCLNPECLKETCRNCKEPNHLPLRCDEIEKKSECDMRISIENRVNEAMIRECYKCHKRFYKEEGCNMMHCVCGAAMCYICRAPIKDYSHFNPKGCPQFSDVNELHKIEMEKAYKEALDKYLAEHPEHKDMQLKNDPKKMLEDIIKKAEASKKVRELQEARMRELQQQHQLVQGGVGGGGGAAAAAAGGNAQLLAQRQQDAAQLAQARAQIMQIHNANAAIRAINPYLQPPPLQQQQQPVRPIGNQMAVRHAYPANNMAVRHGAPPANNPNPNPNLVQWRQAPRNPNPNQYH